MIRKLLAGCLVWMTACALTAESGAGGFNWAAMQGQIDTFLYGGQISQALQLLEESIGSARRRGEQSTHLAEALHTMGSAYYDIGHYAESERAFKESIELWRHHSATGSKLAVALGNLAVLRANQGRHTEAEKLYAEAERALTGVGESPDFAFVLCGMADLYSDIGRMSEAKRAADRAVAIFENAGRPELGVALMLVAKIAVQEKREVEGETLRRRALMIWENSIGKQSRVYIAGLAMLADSLSRKDPAESTRLFRESLELIGRSREGDHVVAGETMVAYARHLRSIGSKDEAKRMKRHGDEILSRHADRNQLGYTVDVRAFQRARRK